MRRRIDLLISVSLAILALGIYARVGRYEFIGLDDPQHISANPRVQAGLTADGVRWAFHTSVQGTWVPLTLISHMVAWQILGPSPGRHHMVNVVLHMVNVVLLFWALRLATGARWRSALPAALLAVHPLHVEAVAWVAERKGLLGTTFWLLTMIAYVAYARRPAVSRYLAVLAAFTLGILSKPTLVTLPLVLFLLDYWPLGRVRWTRKVLLRLLAEKVPLLAVSVIGSLLAFAARPEWEDTITGIFPFWSRVGNAVNSYAQYLGSAVWPKGLAAYYPFPAEVHGVVLSVAVLLLLSLLVAGAGRRHPYLIFAWLWYLGTLVPVIGLIQQGEQARADRYAYVPLIGIYVALAWMAGGIADRGRWARRIVVATATVCLVALAAVAARQVSYWRNEVTLYERILAVTRDNPVIQNNLGAALGARGRVDEAIPHLTEALRLRPDYMAAGMNLSKGLDILRQRDHADSSAREVLASASYRMAIYLLAREDPKGAEARLNDALRAKPGWPAAEQELARLRGAPGPSDGGHP